MMRLIAGWLLLMFVCRAAFSADANERPTSPMPETLDKQHQSINLPLWETGFLAGGITQPAYPGADERVGLVAALPFLIYRGEYVRIERDTVGVRAIRTPRTEVDLGFAASLGSRADNIEARRGMADLGTLIEFGPRLRINLGNVDQGERGSRIQIPVRAVFDLSNHFAYRGIASELQWVKEMELPDGWLVTFNAGLLYGNQDLADTFYRVAPDEVSAFRPAYNARSGLIAKRGSIWASRLFTRNMRVFTYMRFDSVVGAANEDSPLVRRDTGWTVGAGLSWTLSQSEQMAKD